MTRQCRHCQHSNSSRARYCGRCGRPLDSYPLSGEPGKPRAKVCCTGRHSGSPFLFVLLCVGAVGAFWFTNGRPFGLRRGAESGLKRILTLPSAKADAMFDLLKPDDVPVIVDRRRGGIYIKGTPDQVRTVEQFVGLLTRGCNDWASQREGPNGAGSPMIKRTYKLTRSHAKALIRTLTLPDVPMMASRSGSKVKVSAQPEDQGTIDRMVRILGGRHYD